MLRLRRFRKFIVLVALGWLPMSVFAQICATHALVSNVGGPRHPAMIAPEEMAAAEAAQAGSQPVLAVVDAATFWQSVDDYDAGCDVKSICAFASMAVLVSSAADLTFANDTQVPHLREFAFSTHVLTPETPPPRG